MIHPLTMLKLYFLNDHVRIFILLTINENLAAVTIGQRSQKNLSFLGIKER